MTDLVSHHSLTTFSASCPHYDSVLSMPLEKQTITYGYQDNSREIYLRSSSCFIQGNDRHNHSTYMFEPNSITFHYAWHERRHPPFWHSPPAWADRKCSFNLSFRPNDMSHDKEEHLNASENMCFSLMCRHNDVSRVNRRGFVQSFQSHLIGPVRLLLGKIC